MSQLMYSPFSALDQLHRELGRVFADTPSASQAQETNQYGNFYNTAAWLPQVDIMEDESGFSVLADLPGVDPKQVEVTVDRNVLSIRGERGTEISTDERRTKAAYKRRERTGGSFIRQFTLPEIADGNGITARSTNGVLEVRIPKGERNKPLSINIES